MNFFSIVFSFLIIFFSFQLFFGNAGIIAFIQERYITERIIVNVNKLENIQNKLDEQLNLAKTSNRYLKIFAHRVGLLAEKEVYIHLNNSMFDEGNSYSPGTLVLYKKSFYVSNNILFFVSFAIECLIISMSLYRRKYMYKIASLSNTTKEDYIPTNVTTNDNKEMHHNIFQKHQYQDTSVQKTYMS